MIGLRRTLRLCLLATTLASVAAFGALTQLTANRGEVSDLLTVNGTDVFAATQGGGLYKSSTAGASWTRLTGLPSRVRYVNKLAGNDPQTSGVAIVYAATTVGVFRTGDGGTTWTTVYGNGAQAVAVDPGNNANVLIGVKGFGILRSINSGASWAVVSGYDSADVTSIVFQTSSIVWAGFNSNTPGGWGGVFRSGDGGVTWAAPAGGQPANKFVKTVAVDSSNNVYAGTYNDNTAAGGVYTSALGTGAWTLMSTGPMSGSGGSPVNTIGIQTIHKDKAVAGRMWAGTGPFTQGYWRLDSGVWVYANQTQSQFSNVNAFATFTGTANRILIALRGMGVYLSTNGNATFPGLTFATSNTGLAADRVNALAIPSSGAATIYMGLTGGAVQQSTNSGGTWSALLAGFDSVDTTGGTASGTSGIAGFDQIFTVKLLAASPTTATNIYAGVLSRGLYQFNGTTWTPVTSAGLDNSPVAPVGNNMRPRGLLVDADASVYYSIFEKPDGDGIPANDNAGFYHFNGTSWARVVVPPFTANSGAGKIVKAGSAWYALINDDFPFRSTDGTTFTEYSGAAIVSGGFARVYFTDLAANPIAPTTLVASTNKGLFRSTDGGGNFYLIPTTNAFSTTIYSAVNYSTAGNLFAGSPDGQIYCSTTNGDSWSLKTLPAGWANSPITSIVRSGTTLYFLTDGNGAWQEASPTCP